MIRLAAEPRAAIAAHAERDFPNEACGLLLGRRNGDEVLITEAVASANIADQPARRFEIDPGLRLRLQKAEREGGGEVVGHYHSHPNGAARPSKTDCAKIFETNLVWLIAAVDGGRLAAIAAYLPKSGGGGFDDVALQMSGPD